MSNEKQMPDEIWMRQQDEFDPECGIEQTNCLDGTRYVRADSYEADKQRIAELTTLRPMDEAPEGEYFLTHHKAGDYWITGVVRNGRFTALCQMHDIRDYSGWLPLPGVTE